MESGPPSNLAVVANPFENMNLTAKTFVPANFAPNSQNSLQGQSKEINDLLNGNRTHADSVDAYEVFGGY